MRKLFLSTLFVLAAVANAYATCATGAMPFQLQNNTLADATQVMANFNQITSGVGSSCAGSGVNNDITALGALSTPINPSQGGTPVFAGGVTGGTVNAQTLTVNSNFATALTVGTQVTGLWSITNTGPLTISINGGSGSGVYRSQQFGISSTQGGEAIAGQPFHLVWNGAQWILIGDPIIIGEMKTISYNAGTSPPPGWLVADGSSFVCATFQDLCNVIGTTFGGTSSNPNLPDTRGRVLAGWDNYGTGAGAAGRLTNSSTGCGTSFTTAGATCANASQSHTQIVAELAQHNHTDSGHSHTTQSYGSANGGTQYAAGTGLSFSSGTNTGFAVITNTGSSQPMPIVNPNFAVVMIIRF